MLRRTCAGKGKGKKKRATHRRPFLFDLSGEPCGTRTCDPLVKSQLLYRLS